jgi:hypothetical protein
VYASNQLAGKMTMAPHQMHLHAMNQPPDIPQQQQQQKMLPMNNASAVAASSTEQQQQQMMFMEAQQG